MGSIPSSGINFGKRRSLFPSLGGLQGLPVAPSKLSSHVAAFTLSFACIYPLTSNQSMRPKDVHAAKWRQPEQQTFRSRAQAEINVHLSPFLGKKKKSQELK